MLTEDSKNGLKNATSLLFFWERLAEPGEPQKKTTNRKNPTKNEEREKNWTNVFRADAAGLWKTW